MPVLVHYVQVEPYLLAHNERIPRMSQPVRKSCSGESLEDQIFRRLRDWQLQHPDGDGARDLELEGLIYQFLYLELRSIATVLPGLGWQSIHQHRDGANRYTSLLNKAFLRIIEKYPDKLMQTRTRQQLTGYVSRTMSNLMLNHYKREDKLREIMQQLGLSEAENSQVRDILSHLAEDKADYFEYRTSLPFARGLEMIHRWDQSADPIENSRAAVLRLRYVDGLSYDEIAREMSVDRPTVEKLLEQAKYHLRKLPS